MKKIYLIILVNLVLLGAQYWQSTVVATIGQQLTALQSRAQALRLENQRLQLAILQQSSVEQISRSALSQDLRPVPLDFSSPAPVANATAQ